MIQLFDRLDRVVAVGSATAAMLFFAGHALAQREAGPSVPPRTSVPACTLAASSDAVTAGRTVTLTAKCAPEATYYAWTNTGFSNTSASGVVAPRQTTTYSVIGSNAAGRGNSVSITVKVLQDAVAAATPVCTLNAGANQMSAGDSVRLTANCRPAASAYVWTGTAFPTSASSGSVSPTATTTYSVRGRNEYGDGNTASTTVLVTATPKDPTLSASTQYANDYCASGLYPQQWEWNAARVQPSPQPATSGTPRMTQIRDGVVIATYNNLGGDAGYSKPNSADGSDPSVGPFRRRPYTQWKSGDVFEIYPAVYSGATMQIYLGPNIPNDAAFGKGVSDMPQNITIRGVTVNGVRPVIVNPPSGASYSNYNQSLIYVDGKYDSSGALVTPSTNITLENIDIQDSSTGGFIGKAAVYVNGAANLTLRNMRIAGFKRHQVNGVFATGNNTGTLLFDNVELDGNGGANGPEHNAYINASKTDPNFTFMVRGSWSHGSYYGHALKSRAQRTVVEGSYLSGTRAAAGQQTETYLLDVPDGGTLIARNNIFVKNYSGNQSNGASITFGVESQNPARKWELLLEHNTFVAFSRYYDDAAHQLFPMYLSSAAPGAKTVDSNLFVGYCQTGQAHKDFRGTNPSTLNFNEIDQAFRPRAPLLTGRAGIVGTPQYDHLLKSVPRRSNAVGAKD